MVHELPILRLMKSCFKHTGSDYSLNRFSHQGPSEIRTNQHSPSCLGSLISHWPTKRRLSGGSGSDASNSVRVLFAQLGHVARGMTKSSPEQLICSTSQFLGHLGRDRPAKTLVPRCIPNVYHRPKEETARGTCPKPPQETLRVGDLM